MTTLNTRLLAGALLCAPLTLPAQTERQLDAHVHGHGQLQVVLEDPVVAVGLNLPGMDVVGFEHAPQTDAQQQAVADALAQLEQADSLFALSEAAGCSLAQVETALIPMGMDDHDHDHEDDHADDHDHDHGDDHDHQASHTEFQAEYRYACEDLAALEEITLILFEQFPALQSVEAQAVGPTGQTARTLTPDDAILSGF